MDDGSQEARARERSLLSRYLAKLLVNVAVAPIGLVQQALIPRFLGPNDFGVFVFLQGFFLEVCNFVDAGTTSCFYTKLSCKPTDRVLVRFFSRFACAAAVLLWLATCLVGTTSLGDLLWPQIPSVYVFWALAAAILTWVAKIGTCTLDAHGLTVDGELVRLLQRIFGVGALIGLFFLGHRSLSSFYMYQLSILLVFIGLAWMALRRKGRILWDFGALNGGEIKQYAREFYDYGHPLFLLAVFALIGGLGDRWLLQKFGGSIQQGFFGLSYQAGAVCFLFTSAMTPLFTRELALAETAGDSRRLTRLTEQYVPMFFSIAALLSVFLAFKGNELSLILGGKDFGDARVAMSLMMLYPIHQTYGQLVGAIYFATGRTAVYRNVCIAAIVLGMPLTWLLIAPKGWLGMALGAEGLAAKMVAMQFLSTNALLWLACRKYGIAFGKFVYHQVGTMSLFGVIGWLADFRGDWARTHVVAALILSGCCYFGICALVGWRIPFVFGDSATARMKEWLRVGWRNRMASYR